MQRLGKVLDWNDERGYGFIAPLEASDGGKTFFHIRDYQQQGRRPEPGELVRYMAERQDDGRWRATKVMRAVQPRRNVRSAKPKVASTHHPYTAGHDLMRVALVLAYICLMGWAIKRGLLPFEFVFVPAITSIVAYMAYAADKHFAQSGHWRIAEANLHLLELLSGWPGALVAQRLLRHKTRKTSYRVVFWMMVLLNLMATLAWIYLKY